VDKYSDDQNSKPVSGGLLGTGTSKELLPKWSTAKYAEEFKKNEAGLKQMGITSAAALRDHREGRHVVHCDAPPRQARTGSQSFSERSGSGSGSYREQFERNEAGLRQLGVNSPEELKRRLAESKRA
jgi:hypothetical protein